VSSNADSIYSVDTTGKRKFITLGFDPKVSPSGDYMAFENGPSYSSLRANIWMRNLSAKKDTLTVNNPSDYLNYFDFYSSEAQIVYAQSCNIYTSNINGSNAYTFLVCTPCDCYSDDPQIRYSDGEITYHNQHYGIYTCSSNGSNPEKFANTVPGDMYPTWSVNGKFITYIKTSRNNNLYKLNTVTGDTTQLTFFTFTDTIWANPNFSQDGKFVYFIARINNKPGIYKVTANGTGHYNLVYAFNKEGSIYDYFLGKSNTTNIKTFVANNNLHSEDMYMAADNKTPGIQAYPNPAFDRKIHLQLNNTAQGSYIISVSNTNGEMVCRQAFENTGKTTSITVNLKNAVNGIYKIEMRSNSNCYFTTALLQ
jgi:Tol biopolymer transport system component